MYNSQQNQRIWGWVDKSQLMNSWRHKLTLHCKTEPLKLYLPSPHFTVSSKSCRWNWVLLWGSFVSRQRNQYCVFLSPKWFCQALQGLVSTSHCKKGPGEGSSVAGIAALSAIWLRVLPFFCHEWWSCFHNLMMQQGIWIRVLVDKRGPQMCDKN